MTTGMSPMRSIGYAVLLCGVVTAASGQDVLIWSDEFDGTSLNLGNWEYMIGNGDAYGVPGWGNNEWEYYTSRPENIFVDNGVLNIVAREESYAGYDYTSARIRSMNKADFLYGRLEASIKLPFGQGIWPAFWMLPTDSPYGGWAAGGEIDIVETVNMPWDAHGTIHYGGGWPNNVHSGGSTSIGQLLSDAFHTYAIEWETDTIRWYLDGNLYHTETSSTWYSTGASHQEAPFDVPFHFLLNVAVGGNWPGYPDHTTQFPQTMQVDWVRVYGPQDQAPFYGEPQDVAGRIEAEDFDLGPDGQAYHDCDGTNNGGEYRSTGVDIQVCDEGGYNVGWMCEGEWLEYAIMVPLSGTYTIDVRVASQSSGGTCHLEISGVNITGPLTIPATGGWQTWTSITTSAFIPAGPRQLRFVNDSTNDEYNLNYIQFYSPADLDVSGAVDAADMSLLGSAMAGPDVSTPPGGVSQDLFDAADLEWDNDVDMHDCAIQQRVAG